MSLQQAESTPDSTGDDAYDWVSIFSLGWLLAANLVGMLLATLLLFPGLNAMLAPCTYGRWVPLHLNFQLYGWFSLPLLGLLCRCYVLPQREAKTYLYVAGAWSLVLVYGGLCWLSGEGSGKLFLDWSGSARYAFIGLQAVLIVLFGEAYVVRLRAAGRALDPSFQARAAKLLLLLGLASVPLAFLIALDPASYPPINTRSSGATGASLLISTLGITLIFWALPLLLQRHCRHPRRIKLVLALLTLHIIAWGMFVEHGNSSNADMNQEISIFSLLPWMPLLVWYYLSFDWPEHVKGWLLSLTGWGFLLICTATVMFIPQFLDRFKFTDILVGHVHLAMGGLCSSFLMVLLGALARKGHAAVTGKTAFFLWHLGLSVYLMNAVWMGIHEVGAVEFTYGMSGARDTGNFVRLCGGACMTLASACWLYRSIRIKTNHEI